MIDFNKIENYTETINKNNEKLKSEKDFKKKEKLKLKIQMDLLRIKIERLN
jgi:hypothetical protein